MIILSFLFRGKYWYGIIKNPPAIEKYINYDGFEFQSKDIFELFLDSERKKVTVAKNVPPEKEKQIRDLYCKCSEKEIQEIIRSFRNETTFNTAQNLFLKICAVYTEKHGWQYRTVYDETDVVSQRTKSAGMNVDCVWTDNIKEVIACLNGGNEND